MSQFITTLKTELVDEHNDIHQLLEPLVYHSDMLGSHVVVPAGFKTDFASVPRIILAYLFFGGKGKRAAVIHDWAYSGGIDLTRYVADELFREALKASGYSDFTIWFMYQGVRIGGGWSYNSPNIPQEERVTSVMEAP